MQKHPFGWLAPRRRLLVVLVLLAGSIIALVLHERVGPSIGWQGLARHPEIAQALLRDAAMIRGQMRIDSVLLLLYPPMLSLLCLMLAERAPGMLRRIGFALSWIVLLGIVADGLENRTVLSMLREGPSRSAALLTGWAGTIKLILIYTAINYIVITAAALLIARRRHSSLA